MDTAVSFKQFGGLRLDLSVDEVGGEQAIFARDVDWDGSLGNLRSRYGFQKLKAAEATGTYKGLFPHSSLRLLAVKRIKEAEVKIVAIDREGTEKVEATWPSAVAKSSFTRIGTPSASYTYGRANTTSAKVVRFDGTEFKEPTATVDGVASKEMPKGNLLASWENRLISANTGATGGPNGAASSASHVWFSKAGEPEAYESTAYSQVGAGDGEEITALAVYYGQLFVFKETKFFVFYSVSLDEEGKPEFNDREVSLGEGSRMKRATSELLAESSDQLATVAPTGVYFCTTDGVYVTRGGEASKLSQALKPLEEATSFTGPMSEFLNGSLESFRWPAAGIAALGQRIIVRRYEFMFVYDIATDAWTCWKMPAVSMAVWTGLSGGGAEVAAVVPGKVKQALVEAGDVTWTEEANGKAVDGKYATSFLTGGAVTKSYRISFTELGLAIPESALISGIELLVWSHSEGLGSLVKDLELRLLKASVPVGTNKAGLYTPATPYWLTEEFPAASRTYGGPEDLWGEPWTRAQLVESGFGFCLRAENATPGGAVKALLDGSILKAYYLIPSSSTGVRPRLFCTQSKSVFYTAPTAEEQAGTREPAWQSGFYDLGSDDEKELSTTRVWGSGTVKVQVAEDFGELGTATEAVLGTAPVVRQAEFNKDQKGVLFSHRLLGTAPWTVQRLARYLRETRVPGTKVR